MVGLLGSNIAKATEEIFPPDMGRLMPVLRSILGDVPLRSDYFLRVTMDGSIVLVYTNPDLSYPYTDLYLDGNYVRYVDSFRYSYSAPYYQRAAWNNNPGNTYPEAGSGSLYLGFGLDPPIDYVCFSSLDGFVDLRQEGEVKYAYAACVILVSFLLFSLFRSLWRSIRGRMD